MLDQYRREYTEFNTACMREHYLFLSGQKSKLDIAPVYEKFEGLFELDAVTRLRQLLSETPEHFETARKSLTRFLLFAVEQFLENSVKTLTAQINEQESSSNVRWNHQSMTFHDAAVALACEPNRETRRAIHHARLAIIEQGNSLRAERLSKLHQSSQALGAPGYRALFEGLRSIDYSRVASGAEKLLTGTQSVLEAALSIAVAENLGIPPGEAHRYDAIYFLHLSEYDERFPVGALLPVYGQTMAELGIQVAEQRHIYIDAEPRPTKTSRAFCMPITIPDEVKLVIRPTGGQSDYQSLLHEAGHAQHYGWTSRSLAPEFKYTGDYALTETYAFLFNHLVADRQWLSEMIGFTDSDSFIRSMMLARLITVRRYAGKLIYELQLHDGLDLDAASTTYADLQTRATGFIASGSEFLFDLDDAYYAAGYLRAWALEVAFRDYLKSQFGSRWWASRKAGSLLRELWETGDQYSADEMAQQIGIGSISFEPLISEFQTALA